MKLTNITFLLLIFLIFRLQGQHTFYISPNGNDNNNGSIQSPWQHFDFAVSQLQAGDTLFLRSGNYTGNALIQIQATPSNPVVIQAYPNETATIEGTGLPADAHLLKIENALNIKIKNLIFSQYTQADAKGIFILNSSHIEIENCEFNHIDFSPDATGQIPSDNDNAQPLIVMGTDPTTPVQNIQIKLCRFHDCITGQSEVLALNGNVDGFIIENNTVYNNSNIGIDIIGFENTCPDPNFDQARNGIIKNNLVYGNQSPYDEAAGIYVDGGKNIIIENNIVHHNDYGLEIGCENNGQTATNPAAENITARNNLIFSNKSTGLALGGYDYPVTGKVSNVNILNNTFFNNDTDNNYNGEMFISYTENARIENNIFYATNSGHVLYIEDVANPQMHFDYNLYFVSSGINDLVVEINGNEYNTFSGYQNSTQRDMHSVFSDPQFVNTGSNPPDLHLTSQSPAIDNGNPAFVPAAGETDMDGETRVFGQQVDCGADEFNPNTSVVHEETIFSIYPNPVEHDIFLKNVPPGSHFMLLDLQGKIIRLGKAEMHINLNGLKKGIYLFQLTGKHNSRPIKIIKN